MVDREVFDRRLSRLEALLSFAKAMQRVLDEEG